MEIITDVMDPPYNEYYAYGIDNSGTIVGEYVDWSAAFEFLGRAAFVRPEGETISKYNVLDFDDTCFTSISDCGCIAGTAAGQSQGLFVEPVRCD
jgi:hypothetical protein